MFSKYFKKLDSNNIQCLTCNRYCIIPKDKTGFCKVRKNQDGKLVSLVYGKPISVCVDPIEKKPLYNFLQKTKTLSFGTPGCNFDCAFCQNCSISNCSNINLDKIEYISPEDIVALAKKNKTPSISYTYTEPTVFVEFALDTMKLAHKEGIKNIWVTNGYFSKEVFKDISKYLDAANIDLKGSQDFYDKLIPGINLEKIKENIIALYKKKIHIEVTNLLIEGYNTRCKDISEIVDFVYSVSQDIPLHFSKSFGNYRLQDITPTRLETLKLAEEIARAKGLKVYLGNI